MKINGNVEIKGFTTIADLDFGAVFVFYDDNELMLKGYERKTDYTYAIRLNDGAAYDIYDENWDNRPVREIKAVLTVK